MRELHESASATADANGRAVAKVQPMRAFEKWNIDGYSVASTSSVLVPTVRIYRGSENPSSLVEGTYSGNLDHSDTKLTLMNGEALLAVWSGADVGAQCTFKITGTREGRT